MGKETVNLKEAQDTANPQGEVAAPAKKKVKKGKELDAKNREAIKGKARKEKDLMYRYIDKEGNPVADEDKKKYRASARKRFDSYAKKIKAAKGDEKAKLIKKANTFLKRTYNAGIKEVFA